MIQYCIVVLALFMKKSTKENLVLGLTAARLLQAGDYSKRIRQNRPIRMATAAIMAVDLADGIIARWLGVDGPKRRLADSTVDSALIATGLYSTLRHRPETRPWLGLLAAREVFVGSGWVVDLMTSQQPKKGDNYHKLASASVAAASVAANHYGGRVMKSTAVTATVMNGMLAYDYFQGWTQPDRNTILDTGVAEVPGFYEPRMAMQRLVSGQLQLTAGNAPAQIEASSSEPYIDSSCVESS